VTNEIVTDKFPPQFPSQSTLFRHNFLIFPSQFALFPVVWGEAIKLEDEFAKWKSNLGLLDLPFARAQYT